MTSTERASDARRPSIWLVNLFFGSGTAPTGALLESAALELARRGCDVTAVCSNASYGDGGETVAKRFQGRIVRLWTPRVATHGGGRLIAWLTFYLSVWLWSFTRRLPDQAIVMTTPPFLHWILVLRSLVAWKKCEIVLWNQDTYPEILASAGLLKESSLIFRGLSLGQRMAGRCTQRAIALDSAMARLLRSHGLQHIEVLPNWQTKPSAGDDPSPLGHDLEEVLPQAASAYRYLVLYTGNYGWGHNLDVVLRYLAERPDQTDFFFLFVGGGEHWRKLRALQHERQPAAMEVRGYVPEATLVRLLAAADLGLVALETQCVGHMSPSKMHRYLQAGLTLLYVGGAGSNVSESIENYGCGWRVGEEDYAGFVKLLAQLADPDFALTAYADRARQAFERHRESAGAAALANAIVGRLPEAATSSSEAGPVVEMKRDDSFSEHASFALPPAREAVVASSAADGRQMA